MTALLQRIGLVASGVLLAVAVVVAAVVTAKAIDELSSAAATVGRPSGVQRTLLRLMLTMSDAETAQRGYLLTGNESYVAPYAGTHARTDSLLAQLDTLVVWNARQVARMPGLRAAIAAKHAELDTTLALARAGRRADALEIVQTNRGAVLMDTLRARADRMQAEANRVRLYWEARAARARRNALLATVATHAVLIGLVVLVVLGIRGRVRRREQAAAEMAVVNASLSQALAERESALARVQTMQAQLVQQEKLAGLGRLTAGVAHELKNPLNFVNNFAQLTDELGAEAQAALEAGRIDEARDLMPDLRTNTAKILEHGRRADEIVRTMLVHARGVSGERHHVALDPLLAQAISQALGPDDYRSVEVVRGGAEGLEVWGVASALSRLFLNVIENAVHAVRERAGLGSDMSEYVPTVWIRTDRRADRIGRTVAVVTIEDNGAGIPDTVLPRVFEPFFTTKTPGQGTGLGLSLAYDIAVGHGGSLMASRGEHGGALFTVTLPIEPLPDAPDETEVPGANLEVQDSRGGAVGA